MALTKRDLVQIASLVKDAVSIATAATPAGAIARTGYAIAKRTPQGEAFVNELTARGYDALQVAIAIQQEFATERPMDRLLTEFAGNVSTEDFKIRPLGVYPKVPMKKRKANKFSKAVKVAMDTIKNSTSYGKKGVINNAKKAFSLATKTASKIYKGGKVAKNGIRRKIGLAIKKVI
tara:strand:- start:1257 stop:1787 length:531 start_codon:yes stop_codon:yes gene_type:complete